MKRIFLGVFMSLAWAALPVQANFEDAMQDYSAGNFPKAYRSFDALAAIGDYSAMFNLGVMHYRGEHVPRDPAEGWAWMQLAASQTEAEAFANTAQKVLASLSPEERDKASTRLDTLLRDYSRDALNKELAPVLLPDEDCNADRIPVSKKPPRYPRKELRRGNFGRVVVEYSVMPAGHVRDVMVVQSSGSNFSKAAAESALYYRYDPIDLSAPTTGVKTAISFLMEGEIANRRKLVAELNEWRDKAQAGDGVAQYVYAYRLNVFRSFKKYMEGVDLEYQTANKWYLESAKQGIPHAQYQIGRNMIAGRGCEADTKAGLKWISAAAVGGLPEAQQYLASTGSAMPADERRKHAIRWLKNASANDHYFSGLLLAWELVSGPNPAIEEELSLAQELVDAEPVDYFDEVRMLETQAAVAAAKADFKSAQRLQKQAIETAERLEWDSRDAVYRQETYKRGEKWSGPYFYDIELEPVQVQASAY